MTLAAVLKRRWRLLVLAVVVLAAVGTAARGVHGEYRRRAGLYWYDVTLDTRVSFPADANRHLVPVAGDALRWPVRPGGCDTAVLRLRVRASIAGRWLEPAVRIAAAGLEPFDQYFERGARGARWLNLSPLCAGARENDLVRLEGRHLEWGQQDAELVMFRTPALGGGPLLVLAPHPDDAEIAAFGLYRSRLSFVVTLTAGDYVGRGLEHLVADAGARASLRGRLRVWDSAAVPLWGGVPPDRVANLGYFNGLLEEMHARRGDQVGQDRGGSAAVRAYRVQVPSPLLRDTVAESSWDSLVADLTLLLRTVKPAAVVAPHPLLDRSSDHRFATAALLEALERAGEPALQLLLYTNHAEGSEYFPFGPADGWVTIPPAPAPTTIPEVYSFPLSPDAMLDKLFALDAMHDLRAAPRRQLGEATQRELRAARRLLRDLWRDPHDYYSYFRRAARPNELFFVVGVRDRDELRASFARWHADNRASRR
jgi:LmbE family N-acetylglucosaminyl deacetylase